MNIDEILKGNNSENLTPEQIENAINETVKSFTNIKDLNDFLVKLHPSDAYKIIRDVVKPSSSMIINSAKIKKDAEYQRFQEISMQSKSVFEYEKKTATIFDVQQVSTSIAQHFYGITLRMISKLDDELGRVELAVNRLEGQVGLIITNFTFTSADEEIDNDNK